MPSVDEHPCVESYVQKYIFATTTSFSERKIKSGLRTVLGTLASDPRSQPPASTWAACCISIPAMLHLRHAVLHDAGKIYLSYEFFFSIPYADEASAGVLTFNLYRDAANFEGRDGDTARTPLCCALNQTSRLVGKIP